MTATFDSSNPKVTDNDLINLRPTLWRPRKAQRELMFFMTNSGVRQDYVYSLSKINNTVFARMKWRLPMLRWHWMFIHKARFILKWLYTNWYPKVVWMCGCIKCLMFICVWMCLCVYVRIWCFEGRWVLYSGLISGHIMHFIHSYCFASFKVILLNGRTKSLLNVSFREQSP